MNPQVDVVILNHNGKKFLPGCIDSLLKGDYPNQQIYLLDNASTDDDVAFVKSHYPMVKIIANTENNGYCAAYNLAFSRCTGKYLVCLNNDVEVEQDWLTHLVDLAETDEQIAAIQPKLVSFFNPKEFEYAGASGGMMDVYGFPFLRGRIFTEIEQDEGQYDDVIEVFWTTGAAMFLRKSALEVSGNLDEAIVHHMDEIDLCWRLHMAGFRLLVQPASVVRHIGGATIQTQSFKKTYWNHRNSLYIMMKNYEWRNVLRYVPIHYLLDYVAWAQALVSGKWAMVKAIPAAHWWICMNGKLIRKKRQEVQDKRRYDDGVVLQSLYPKSIVLEFFLKGNKHYSSLKYK